MSRYYQRPENALKRANEFIEVEKPMRALDSLGEVIKSKKYRTTTYSEKVLEPIMIKYLELCVDLKKAYMAKEGLFQYRNMCQAVNVASLENVVRFYLQLAEERTEAARQESHQAVIDIDDLDNVATPESLLLRAVSGEDAQDRSDRVILLPWVKFLWESYRQCLELLRTNSRVEKLYHDTAQQAFKFCLKYSRKTEFRKLCENLRSHLGLLSKGTPSPTSVNMNNPETQQMNLETRLLQLDFAIQMELWQEAYKAIEDIHGLMTLSKKMPKPQQMAQYYQKLALVFGKAGNHLFHAAALFRLFQLSRDLKKNITAEEVQKLGSRVMMATLAIPLPSAHPEFDRFIETEKSAMEKTQKLATLLHLTQQPTRVGLIKDLVRLGIVQIAMPQLQQLYKHLEVEFDPLHLCSKVKVILEGMAQSEDTAYLTQYIPALEEITLTRLIKQITQMYSTIEFNRLLQLAPFATAFDLEKVVVNAVRHNDMQIRIDHRNKCLHFGTDLSEAQREDLPEGPTLQVMPSEQIRTHLISMYTVLGKATASIRNQPTSEELRLKSDLVRIYHQTKASDHAQLLRRQRDIEMRKEYLEKLNNEREEEEVRRQEEIVRQQMLAEQRRLEQERLERERLRQEAELRQAQARHLKEKVNQISQTAAGQRIIKKLEEEDLSKLDPDVIMARQVEEMEKERKELQAKLKSQEKKVDYVERAKRQEEIPLLEKYLEERQVQDRVIWEQQEKERIVQLLEERKLAVAHRDRLLRMKEEKDGFVEKLVSARRNVHKQQLEEFEKMYNAEKANRLALRREQRKEQRRQKWINEKEEEEQRKREEELKRQREEAEQAELARREAEEEEYRKRKAAIEASLEKQRQKEREIEEKLREKEMRDKEQERLRREEKDKDRKPPEPSSWRREAPAEPAPREGGRPNLYVPPMENKTWRSKGDKYARPGPESEEEPERKDRPQGSSWRARTEKAEEPVDSDRYRDRAAPPPERRLNRDFDREDRGDRDRDSRGGRDFASLRSGPRAGDAPRERRMDDRRDDRRMDDRRDERRMDDRRDDRRMDDRRDDRRMDDRRDERRDDRRMEDRGAPRRSDEPAGSWRQARPAPSDDRDSRPRPSADDRPRQDRGFERDPRGKVDRVERDGPRGGDRDREIRRPVDSRSTAAEREEERKQRQRREEPDEDGFTRVARR